MEFSGQLSVPAKLPTDKLPHLSLNWKIDLPQSWQPSPQTSYHEGRTESHEQLFFACELGTAEEGECGGRWNQLLCYP